MFIAQAIRTDGIDPGQTHLFIVDGDGTELDMGSTAGSITAPADMFSTLTPITGGYELSNAGPPERIELYGNFTYIFNSAGHLTELHDPQGNIRVRPLQYILDKFLN